MWEEKFNNSKNVKSEKFSILEINIEDLKIVFRKDRFKKYVKIYSQDIFIKFCLKEFNKLLNYIKIISGLTANPT